ncbi:MAG TPA: CRISPR system precrRNA processing endoribonuclease RAMP protein Cas6 [Chloroflexaceae bacterium]|nr:CRISPR system precrRNA processing endoribonuclease RAMP protein Cas6 [Chloroflexaceae bacterium]
MPQPPPPAAPIISFPPLSVLRARLTYRLLEDTVLPTYKGALLRGGFGYTFQRASCAQSCWGRAERCDVQLLCPYRWVFETPHPAGVPPLHDLQDVPRPFVIEPPLDHKQRYAAGDTLDFGLVLIGRGVDFLPYFLVGFEGLGAAGLGRDEAKARLERVEALEPFRPFGVPIYQDGRALAPAELPLLNLAELPTRAADLAADLRLELRTPLRVKSRGAFIEQLDLGAIVQAALWRLGALAVFHGPGLWRPDLGPLVEAARAVRVERSDVRWVDWERTSTRGGGRRRMTLGGLIGSAALREVPLAVRAALLAAGVLHVGKASVFGHGWVTVAHL